MGTPVNMTWWRKHSSTVFKLLLLIALWIPEVAVAYVAWNTPLWYVGAVLSIIFCVVYGVLAVFLTLAIVGA